VLSEISPLLSEGLLTEGRKEGKEKSLPPAKEQAPRRDTTWQIRIGKEIFELKPVKGKKKIAIFPWENLRALARREGLILPSPYLNLRGKIVMDGMDLAVGERISNIFKIARFLDLMMENWKGSIPKATFHSQAARKELIQSLDHILRTCKLKKAGKRLGFLGLFTDNKGTYWFKPSPSFFTALEISLSSLETLIDELGGVETQSKEDAALLERVNRAYRALNSVLEA
jgi:hypothetical protein